MKFFYKIQYRLFVNRALAGTAFYYKASDIELNKDQLKDAIREIQMKDHPGKIIEVITMKVEPISEEEYHSNTMQGQHS